MAETNPQYQLPDEKTLAAAGELPIYAEDGTAQPFKALYTRDPTTRNLIIFIRHFFCGSCEQYVHAVSTALPPSLLAAQNPPVTLSIIGCGQSHVIASYKARTACPFDIYADPTRSLYGELGMVCNLRVGERRPGYVSKGFWETTLGSVWEMVKRPGKAVGGGDYSQNGGEWVFERDGALGWCHRMAVTSDHAEVGELRRVLGVQG
ncbi:hypothetical protein MBLNU230_g8515t1 [Neophaeotheca triangularis]